MTQMQGRLAAGAGQSATDNGIGAGATGGSTGEGATGNNTGARATSDSAGEGATDNYRDSMVRILLVASRSSLD